MKRLCDDHRAELGVEYVGDLDRQGACVVCEMANELKERREIISDWIVDMAMKDDGAIFWKQTPRDRLAPITYRDLDKLAEMDHAARTSEEVRDAE